jgi:DNA-binding NarL/FixJ family response regulator
MEKNDHSVLTITIGLGSLTDQEMLILQEITNGLSEKEIAGKLCRSPKTISRHKDNLQKKLGLKSRNELYLFAGKIENELKKHINDKNGEISHSKNA